MIDIESLRSTKLYKELIAAHGSDEGNLLENTDGSEVAQIQFIVDVIEQLKPDVIIETGTNKALFGYIVSQFTRKPVNMITFDIDPRSSQCVYILRRGQLMVDPEFVFGDSRVTVPRKHTAIRNYLASKMVLAWIDGGHAVPYALSDLTSMGEMGVRYILVDDYKGSPDVPVAVHKFMEKFPEYKLMQNPYEGDKRGIIFLINEPNE